MAEPAPIATTVPSFITKQTVRSELSHCILGLSASAGNTVAFSFTVSPMFESVTLFCSSLIPVTGRLSSTGNSTFTTQKSVKPPSTVVAVTTEEPSPTATTIPLSITRQTEVLALLHFTFLLSAFSGNTSAVNCLVAPIDFKVKVRGSTFTPITGWKTVISQSSESSDPSAVVTLTRALPLAWAVTTPFSTVATLSLLDVHTKFLLSASFGEIEVRKVVVSPTFIEHSCFSSETLVTGCHTVISHTSDR